MTLKEELRQFLMQPRPLPPPPSPNEVKNHLYVPPVPDPPIIPSHLGNLPPEDYIDLALEYIDQYTFSRDFIKYKRKKLQPFRYTPLPKWRKKARLYLRACVKVDRSCLAPIAGDPSYDSAYQKLRFVHEFIFKERWKLEELASQLMSLVGLVRSKTRIPSAVSTPMITGDPRDRDVVKQVRERDVRCRMTGIASTNDSDNYADEEMMEVEDSEQMEDSGEAEADLEVTHGLPFSMGTTSFNFVYALTGIRMDNWDADCVQNALLLRRTLHSLFAAFKLYLEWSGDDSQIFIRRRGTPLRANPMRTLRTIVNDEGQICSGPGVLIDRPLRLRQNANIPDIEKKYFILHKFIGDISWICGGAEPQSDDEDDEKETTKVLNDDNFDIFVQKLESPAMNFFLREGIIGKVWVPKEIGVI
ncbi:hypothetical protein BT96DRAFT_916689, partial [Gymnopus androsaceus JB14]